MTTPPPPMTIPNPLATAPTMAVITTSTSMDPQQYDMSDLDVLEVLRDVDEQLAGDGEIFHFPRKEIEEDGINVLTSETNDVDFIDSFVPVSPDHRDEASVDTSSSGTTASYPTPTYNNDVSEYAVAVAVAVAVPIAPRNTKKSIKAKQKADEGAKKTNANRKRKLQTEISSVPPQVVELTDEQRRRRNRDHAKKSRQRKKSLTCTLETSVKALQDENKKLREVLNARVGKTTMDSILQKEQARSREQFLVQIQNPANHVVDARTSAFLKSLQKNLHIVQRG